jgi:hypothetical protein
MPDEPITPVPQQATAPKRFKFEGHRHGEKFVGPHSVHETDLDDGGTVLSDQQADFFRNQGKVLTELPSRQIVSKVHVAREHGLNDGAHPNAVTIAEKTGKTTDPDLAVRGKKGELSDANAHVTPEKVDQANRDAAADENAKAAAAANAAATTDAARAANTANDRRPGQR